MDRKWSGLVILQWANHRILFIFSQFMFQCMNYNSRSVALKIPLCKFNLRTVPSITVFWMRARRTAIGLWMRSMRSMMILSVCLMCEEHAGWNHGNSWFDDWWLLNMRCLNKTSSLSDFVWQNASLKFHCISRTHFVLVIYDNEGENVFHRVFGLAGFLPACFGMF